MENMMKFGDLVIGQAFDWQREGEAYLPFRRIGPRTYKDWDHNVHEINRLDVLVYIGEH